MYSQFMMHGQKNMKCYPCYDSYVGYLGNEGNQWLPRLPLEHWSSWLQMFLGCRSYWQPPRVLRSVPISSVVCFTFQINQTLKINMRCLRLSCWIFCARTDLVVTAYVCVWDGPWIELADNLKLAWWYKPRRALWTLRK